MKKISLALLATFIAAPMAIAQMPPPPKDDFPKPGPSENKKSRENKSKKMHEQDDKHGVKPALPVVPPTPEPTAPDEPTN
jgi:hypothetical protein